MLSWQPPRSPNLSETGILPLNTAEMELNSTRLTGLTWGHKRAIAPVLAASNAYSEQAPIEINWKIRGLESFEHQPLQEAAKTVDLVVFDHPFCGIIAQTKCLSPLSANWIARALGPKPEQVFVGRSYESYFYDNRLWGLPIDAACNHAIYRTDLIEPLGHVPDCWDEVLHLGKAARRTGRSLVIGARGHHGLLAVAALMANAGNALPECRREEFTLDADALHQAIDQLRELLDLCVPESLDWNSIDVHDAMTMRNDLVYCPIVYGFASYGENCERQRLAFAPLPGCSRPYESGAVIGGAAIGISSSSTQKQAAEAFLAFLAQGHTQMELFGRNSGQPASREAWHSPVLDKSFNGFFANVLPSMERCSMRPRFVGYQQFEQRSGNLLERGLRARHSSAKIAADILQQAELVRQSQPDIPHRH